MNKRVLMFTTIMCVILFGCSFNNHQISNLKYNKIKEKLDSDESFILYIGRSDCPDCNEFENTLNSTITIPSNVSFIKLDLKEYRDKSNKKNADSKDIEIYEEIKNVFNVEWVPTIYRIQNGEIISYCKYLDENYHSLDSEKKKENKKYYDKLIKKFIEGDA